MPNRIFLLITLVFTGLAFSLCACSNSANETVTPSIPPPTSTPTIFPTPLPTSTPNINQGTVSIWHSLGDQDIQTLVQIIADFQDKYPDTKFDVLYLPENILLERYRQAVLDGTGPAILLGPASWAPDPCRRRSGVGFD